MVLADLEVFRALIDSKVPRRGGERRVADSNGGAHQGDRLHPDDAAEDAGDLSQRRGVSDRRPARNLDPPDRRLPGEAYRCGNIVRGSAGHWAAMADWVTRGRAIGS